MTTLHPTPNHPETLESGAIQAQNPQDLRLCFLSSGSDKAELAYTHLTARYHNYPPEEATVLVVLGGDGFMLEMVHRYLHLDIPFFGLNCGTVGFLMNRAKDVDIRNRIYAAQAQVLYPLIMTTTGADGSQSQALAFNEVSFLRQERQAAKLSIRVNGETRMTNMICDGLIVSTAAGSTAYNLSAYGPIIPIGIPLLAVTPISAFRPRRWRGALLPDTVNIDVEMHEHYKRPVSVTADHEEVRDVKLVNIKLYRDKSVTLLFDADHNLEERILREQFDTTDHYF